MHDMHTAHLCDGVSNRVYRLRVVLYPIVYLHTNNLCFAKYLEIHSPEFDQIFRVFGGSLHDFESLIISGSGEGVLREGVGKTPIFSPLEGPGAPKLS